MKKITHGIISSFFVLAIPFSTIESASGTTSVYQLPGTVEFQITSSSKMFCVNGALGPRLVTSQGGETLFNAELKRIKNRKNSIAQQIRKLKLQAALHPSNAITKQIATLQRLQITYSLQEISIQQCAVLPPVTPTPTASATHQFQGTIGYEEIPFLEGATIIAQDGTFLGILSIDATANSIALNGGYQFSYPRLPYTNPGSPYSWYNTETTIHPKMYLNGEFVAFLTANHSLAPRLDPITLKVWLNMPV